MTPYTLKQASELLQSKQISAVELAGEYLKAIAAHNAAINGYITLDEEKPLAEARAADARIAAGEATALTGVPVAYKDIFCQTGWRSACASKMLDNFISPYTATVVQNLLDQGMVTLGRTNMDEFAMGSANENSYYGAAKNPWNTAHPPARLPLRYYRLETHLRHRFPLRHDCLRLQPRPGRPNGANRRRLRHPAQRHGRL